MVVSRRKCNWKLSGAKNHQSVITTSLKVAKNNRMTIRNCVITFRPGIRFKTFPWRRQRKSSFNLSICETVSDKNTLRQHQRSLVHLNLKKQQRLQTTDDENRIRQLERTLSDLNLKNESGLETADDKNRVRQLITKLAVFTMKNEKSS